MDSFFPFKSPSRVSVTTAKGTFVAMIEELWGDPDRSLDRADLVGKFKTLARDRLSENQVMDIVSGVEGLRDGTVGPLFDALRSAISMPSLSSGDQPSSKPIENVRNA